MKTIICVALLLAVQAAAQSKKHIVCPRGQHTLQYCLSGDGPGMGCGPEKCVNDPPLKCDKYQHVSHSCRSSNPNDACIDVVGHCEDDLHILTETEWRELMAQINKQKEIIIHVKKLEDLICENNAGILWDCKKGQKVNANGK